MRKNKNTTKAVTVAVIALVLMMTILTVSASAIETDGVVIADIEYNSKMLDTLDIFTDFIKNIGLSIKQAFNSFVYNGGDTITPEFETLLCFGVIVLSITVITIITKFIFKKRSI